jgi:GNAT superfamily N-acetyltransferase
LSHIEFHIVTSKDDKYLQLIAEWYADGWELDKDTAIQKITSFTEDTWQFQVLLTVDGTPVCTAGLYDHVRLLDKEPRFRAHKYWLALVYTAPAYRGKGYGALLCNYITDRAASIGIKEIYLFTHAADEFYKKIGWIEVERFLLGGEKNTVIMKKISD